MLPAGRIGEPGEVARWIVLLLDPAGARVTGAILPVDGGPRRPELRLSG